MAEFIITHKQFDLPLYNKEKYTVLCPKGTTIENWPNIIYFESELDNKIWSELSGMVWIRNNVQSDWITINHYRRIMETFYNHICVAAPATMSINVAQNYKIYHNIADLMICSNIIQKAFPDLYETWLQTLQSNIIYCYNMVSFPKKIYDEYIDTIMTILLTYMNSVKLKTYDDVKARVESIAAYTENNNQRNTSVAYQSRIAGFLGERLTTWYINCLTKTNNQIYTMKVNKFENAW